MVKCNFNSFDYGLCVNFILFGNVDFGETFSTNYIKNENKQTVETSQFIIETPINWIHIFHGYCEEGEAVGSFFTKNGKLRYEYGMFSNPFEIDSIFVFSNDSLTTNRFKVYFGYNDTDETGIYIPRHHEMEWTFSFFMSKSCTDNLDDIILGIKNMEFKKFYNINWEDKQ